MIPHKSRVRHDPPNSYGDCLRASIASILDIDPPELVPHFFHDGCDGHTAVMRLRDFLKEHNTAPFSLYFPGEMPVENVMEWMAAQNPDVHYLLFGRTSSGSHVIVCRNAEVVHDTAWITRKMVLPTTENVWQIIVFIDGRTL